MYKISDIKNTIIQGNTLEVLQSIPDESIDCVITSPPYWGLRDYGIDSQLGLEPTFQEYITNLQTIFDEVYRVLKKTGTCWVNLGDSYNGSGDKHTKGKEVSKSPAHKTSSIQTKSLCNIPFRFAISMTDHKWIQRNTIIWHKPSCMPSSAKDRFTVDFEYVFFFTKNKKYYFEQQFEALTESTIKRDKKPRGRSQNGGGSEKSMAGYDYTEELGDMQSNPNGRNKRTVWCINTQSFKGAHFAVFPPALITPMVEAGSPPEICSVCNKPHLPTYEVTKVPQTENYTGQAVKDYESAGAQNPSDVKRRVLESATNLKTKVGYTAQCDCNGYTHAGIVLDPFMGSGTTAIVAKKLGRDYLGIDLQPDYVKMANKRLAEML